MSFEAGARVGRYEIRSLLGAGGMGEVYRAVDTELHRAVALKVLPPEVAADERRMSRFVQEARAASALNHPNIIAVYEIGESDGARFFVTEFVEGTTLREHMAAGRMSVRDVLDVAVQIASALVKAHSAGIVHRDIKPENVMLTHDGYVKVLDFGLAKFTERAGRSVDSEAATRALVNTDPGSVMGTVSYMSPEQARGQEVDARTDIWSLGIVLYEMLSGQLPFAPGEGATPSHVIVSILEKEPLPLTHLAPEVPPDLAHVVSEALTKDRDERFQTARQMLASLKKVKQRLDAGAELERSVAPEMLGGGVGAGAAVSNPSGGWRPGVTTAGRTTAHSGEVAADLHTTSSAEYVFNQMRSHKRGLFVALALTGLVVAALGFGIFRLAGRRQAGAAPPSASLESMKLTRLPAAGMTSYAAVSPDGRSAARVVYEAGRQSVRLRQLATTSEREIVPPTEDYFIGVTFSPDGDFLYYVRGRKGESFRELYRVSTLGGDPQKLVYDVDSAVAVSPDGRRVAFKRHVPKTNEDTLVVAEVEGGERTLVARLRPATLGTPAWSPDGSKVAYTVSGRDGEGYYVNIEEAAVADGATRTVLSGRWRDIGTVAWLPDASGLVMNARDRASLPNTPLQIWHVSYPEGSARRVTNDLNDYRNLSLTADAKTLLAVQTRHTAHVWVAPGGDSSRARQITSSGSNNVPVWTPDGRVVYMSDASGNGDIWVMNADGTGNRQLTFDPNNDTMPAVSPDGRFVVFVSNRAVGWGIWRVNADGGNPKELVRNIDRDCFPHWSPDSQWVFYGTRDSSGRFVFYKVSAEGGEPVRVASENIFYAHLSPDGRRFLALTHGTEPSAPLRLQIFPVEGGAAVQTLDTPPAIDGPMWSPDGRAVDYVLTRDGVSNLWRLPLAGGKSRQLTDWKNDFINWYSWSADGKQLAAARGTGTTEMVLIKEFR